MHICYKIFVSNVFDPSLSKKLALHINIPILAIRSYNFIISNHL